MNAASANKSRPVQRVRTGKPSSANPSIIKPTRSNSQSHQLQKASVLRTLPPRREPYWAAPLSRGRFVGLRKIDARRASWIARFRNEAGKQRDESTIGASYCDVATRRYCGLAKIDQPVRWRSYDWGDLVRAAVTAADLPAATVLYTLRHSWITTALTSGMGTLDVARLAGTSLLMIERHYGHLVSDAARLRLENVEMI